MDGPLAHRLTGTAIATAIALVCLPAIASAATGELTQLPDVNGCVSDDGTAFDPPSGGGTCLRGKALDGVRGLAVTPGGGSVLAASEASNGVALFARAGDGSLNPGQDGDPSGCITDNGVPGGANNTITKPCVNGRALKGARAVVVSRDGQNAYVAGSGAHAVAVLSLSPGLSQASGAAGCVSRSGSAEGDPEAGTCTNSKGPSAPEALALSPDDATLYVASPDFQGLGVYKRSGDGSLTQLSGTDGCITENHNANGDPDGGSNPQCVDGKGLSDARSVAVSPDGKNVYVASGNHPGDTTGAAVAVLARNSDGSLTQLPGTTGCVSADGTDSFDSSPGPGSCAIAKAVQDPTSVAVAPDGATVYVTSTAEDAIAVFHRNSDGSLTQEGGPTGCASNNGTVSVGVGDGSCLDGRGLYHVNQIALSPDSASVYTTSTDTFGALSFFMRNADGSLSQPASSAACYSNDGTSPEPSPNTCLDGKSLSAMEGLTLDPAGGNLYVAATATDAVVELAREHPAATGGGGAGSGPGSGPGGTGTAVGSGTTGGSGKSKTSHLAVDILDEGTVRARHGTVRVRIRCPKISKDKCIGALRLATTKRYRSSHKGKAKKQTLGSSGFSLKPGQTRRISIELRSSVAKLLKRYSRLRARLTARVGESFDNPAYTKASLTVK